MKEKLLDHIHKALSIHLLRTANCQTKARERRAYHENTPFRKATSALPKAEKKTATSKTKASRRKLKTNRK